MPGAAPQLNLFSDESVETLPKPGELPGFSVRKSARARRLSIKVFPRGRVEVVVPRRTRAREVEAFVSENRNWIARSLRAFAAEFAPECFALPSQIILEAIDRTIAVDYQPDDAIKTVRYRNLGDTVSLSGQISDQNACVKALRRWLTNVARRELGPTLRQLSLELDLPYDRTHIRMQRTCWGSRSSSGTISLNLCLLFLRPEVVRYLMIHELCHGRHMNHSRRFWRLVGSVESNYRQHDRDLGHSWRAVPGWIGVY